MKIAVIGLGYVGAVSSACLARDGHSVTGVDIDNEKLEMIRSGKAPIVEDGIQELMASSVNSKNLTVSDDVAAAVSSSEVSFICVGTPSQRNGSQDLRAIRRVSKQVGKGLRQATGYPVVVVRSTVEPGTTLGAVMPILEKASGKQAEKDFGICFQPEFLREGSSISDYDNPPFTVVGGRSDKSIKKVQQIFEHLSCEFIGTELGSAEMLKYACNSFHALKIGFANEIGRIAQSLSVDSREVMRLLCKDRQLNISSAYLIPGFAFGGSCLPKDLRALIYTARTRDVDVPVLSGLLPSNTIHIEHAVEKVLASGHRKIGMLGLSFKSGTDDLRESPLVVLTETFIGKGLELQIYDPEVALSRLIGANKRYIEKAIPHIAALLTDDLEAIIRNCEVLIIGFKDSEIEQAVFEFSTEDQFVLDLAGLPDKGRVRGTYEGICW